VRLFKTSFCLQEVSPLAIRPQPFVKWPCPNNKPKRKPRRLGGGGIADGKELRMRAVWSFWSRPFHTYYGRIWCNPLHHLLAWGLSLHAASRHYPDTVLITDRPGKKLLIEQLRLPFANVSTELERLDGADPGWWALGKLVAYSLQDQPFVHLDSDVFLWKRLPPHLLNSPVFTQYPEGFYDNDPHYRPQDIEWAFGQQSTRLPLEWERARANRSHFPAENCGILGGSNVEFLRFYSQTAVDLILRPENAAAWSRLHDKRCYNVVVEQFFLSACAEFHAGGESPFGNVRISRLFAGWEDAFNPTHAARVGFTHLVSGAKSHPGVGRRLEERVRRENPAYFRRCQQVLAKSDRLLSA
jgi:hypothetical protein